MSEILVVRFRKFQMFISSLLLHEFPRFKCCCVVFLSPIDLEEAHAGLFDVKSKSEEEAAAR